MSNLPLLPRLRHSRQSQFRRTLRPNLTNTHIQMVSPSQIRSLGFARSALKRNNLGDSIPSVFRVSLAFAFQVAQLTAKGRQEQQSGPREGEEDNEEGDDEVFHFLYGVGCTG